MGFEVFDKRASTSSKEPMVTIQKGGHFSLNRAAYEILGTPESVELLYDRKSKLIGFRPAPSKNPRSYPVKTLGTNATGRLIAGQAFCKYYDIDATVARRFEVEMRDEVLVLDLNSESNIVTGPRSAMKSRLGR